MIYWGACSAVSLHLLSICCAPFLNSLPRLLFSYYCFAKAAARFIYCVGYCGVYWPPAGVSAIAATALVYYAIRL